jgi:hypothetical protein
MSISSWIRPSIGFSTEDESDSGKFSFVEGIGIVISPIFRASLSGSHPVLKRQKMAAALLGKGW